MKMKRFGLLVGAAILLSPILVIKKSRAIEVVPTSAMGSSTLPQDCSISITTGGTAQILLATAINTIRHVIIQNNSTDVIGFSMTTTTTTALTQAATAQLKAATSAVTGDGGSYSTAPGFNDNAPIWVIGATTGSKVYCKWQ